MRVYTQDKTPIICSYKDRAGSLVSCEDKHIYMYVYQSACSLILIAYLGGDKMVNKPRFTHRTQSLMHNLSIS